MKFEPFIKVNILFYDFVDEFKTIQSTDGVCSI